MAQKRMFSNIITDTDRFLDMPASSQNLYFHLNMHADDDGFVDSPKRIMRNVGAGNDDMNVLLSKKFVLNFDSGIILIKDWKIHNVIRKDMYKPTVYTEEKSQIIVDDTKSYQLRNEYVPQNRLDKDRLDKNRLEEDRGGYTPPPPKSNLNFGQFVRAEGLKANENHIQRLLDYIGLDGMDMDLVKLAIARTTEQGIVAPAYTFSILDNWKKKGFTTVEQANQEQEEFEQQKSKTLTTTSRKSNVPSWSNPDYKEPDLKEFALGSIDGIEDGSGDF